MYGPSVAAHRVLPLGQVIEAVDGVVQDSLEPDRHLNHSIEENSIRIVG